MLRVGVAIGATWFVFHDLDFGQMFLEFGRIRFWVVIFALALYFSCQGAMAFRWWLLLKNLHIDVSLLTAVKLNFHGLFFSNFLPSSVGGDFIRAWYVSRHTHKRFQSALSVFVDRFTGLATTLMIGIVTYFIFLRGEGIFSSEPRQGTSRLSVINDYAEEISILVLAFLLILLVCLLIPASRKILFKLSGRLWYLGRRGAAHFLEVLSVFYRKLWLAPANVAITVFSQSLVFVSYWLIGSDLGVTDVIWYYFAFFPFVWVLGSLPISIAGLGILEGGVRVLFVNFAGASPESAAALALCQRAIILASSLPGIWIHLRADYLPKTKEEFFIDDSGSIK